MERKHFQKNPLYSRFFADFESDANDNSNIGNKTTNIYKQNLLCKGYFIISGLDDVLKSGYYESALGFDNVSSFVGEVVNLGNRKVFHF